MTYTAGDISISITPEVRTIKAVNEQMTTVSIKTSIIP